MVAAIALVTLPSTGAQPAPKKKEPRFELRLVLGPPPGTPVAPPSVSDRPLVRGAEPPPPGGATIVVLLVNDSDRVVDVRYLSDLRPTITDDEGAPFEIADVRAIEMPVRRMGPGPAPDLVEPGHTRELVRYTLSPRDGALQLDVPYGWRPLPHGSVDLSLGIERLASLDTFETYRERCYHARREEHLDEATARARADKDAERHRAAYARLRDAGYDGPVRSARYRLTVP